MILEALTEAIQKEWNNDKLLEIFDNEASNHNHMKFLNFLPTALQIERQLPDFCNGTHIIKLEQSDFELNIDLNTNIANKFQDEKDQYEGNEKDGNARA